jgi:hypothetical protein
MAKLSQRFREFKANISGEGVRERLAYEDSPVDVARRPSAERQSANSMRVSSAT